jgi:GAF domain-containing protein
MSTSTDSGPDPSALAELFDRLGRELMHQSSGEQMLFTLSHRAYELIPSAEHAAISRGRHGRFETIAATSDLPPRLDELQYAAGSGPCVDAILGDTAFRVGDLAATTRWPEFGKQAAEQFGIRSMLAVRLFIEDHDVMVGLNLYASALNAFDESDQTVAMLLATHGGLALSFAERQDQVEHLNRALQTSRSIGAAIGILMASHKVSYQQAFGLLRIASQASQRKLADVADDVLLTGALELPPLPEKPLRKREAGPGTAGGSLQPSA